MPELFATPKILWSFFAQSVTIKYSLRLFERIGMPMICDRAYLLLAKPHDSGRRFLTATQTTVLSSSKAYLLTGTRSWSTYFMTTCLPAPSKVVAQVCGRCGCVNSTGNPGGLGEGRWQRPIVVAEDILEVS